MTEPLTDRDVETLLAGRAPCEDLADLADVLDEVRALAHGPVPEPSAELAALLGTPGAGAGTIDAGIIDPVEPAPREATVLALPTARTRGHGWRTVAGGAAATLVVGVGAGALGVLPAAAQERFDRVVDRVGVHLGLGSAAARPASDTTPDTAEKADEVLVPVVGRPAPGDLPSVRPPVDAGEGIDDADGPGDSGRAPQSTDGRGRAGEEAGAPAAGPGSPTATGGSAGPKAPPRGDRDDRDDESENDGKDDREDDADDDRNEPDDDRGSKGQGSGKGKGKGGSPAPGDDPGDEPEDDEPGDEPDEPEEADGPDPDDPDDGPDTDLDD